MVIAIAPVPTRSPVGIQKYFSSSCHCEQDYYAAVTLSPQLISSQQVIKDAVFPFPFFCFSSAVGTMAGKEEKLQQQQYGTFTTRRSILFICDITAFGKVRFCQMHGDLYGG